MNSRDIYRNNLLGAGLSRFSTTAYRAVLSASCFLLLALTAPAPVYAGGSEFASGGARGMGRGGAAFLRADDPHVMVINPALLADLPDDMAMAGGAFAFPDACLLPSGAFSWAADPETDVVVLDENQGPLYMGAKEDDVDAATGKRLTGYKDEPFPKSCYSGGARVFPAFAVSTKIGDKLGLGLGFLPPDLISADSWGNGDGTVNTPKGKRPDIASYTMTPNIPTYFSLLGAIGYRLAPWLRIGAGFRWSMVVLDSANYSNINLNQLSPADAIRTSVYGKDLFIPGFTASIHAVPFDALDVAVGFRWEDRMRFNDFKIDVLTRPFNTGEDLTVKNTSTGNTSVLTSAPSYLSPNLPGHFNAPPLVVPQLTFGIRFADRIQPRNYKSRKRVTEDLRDSMNDERWDIEANAIYYFNSANDKQVFSNNGDVSVVFTDRTLAGVSNSSFPVGPCAQYASDGVTCLRRDTVTKLGGKNQLGLRLGGDINIFPGFLSVRAGASWDSRGLNPDYASPQNLNFQRLGLHAGITMRLAKNTDISLAYAHFFFEKIEVQLNNEGGAEIPNVYKYATDPTTAAKYNIKAEFENGQPTKNSDGTFVLSKLDGVARATYSSNEQRSYPYVNAGTYTYQMDVLGFVLAQHF